MQPNMSRRFAGAVTLMTLCFVLWQCLWAVVTPSFRGPDEVEHFNSVLRVATAQNSSVSDQDSGTPDSSDSSAASDSWSLLDSWPAPGTATVDAQVLRAVHEAGFMAGEDDHYALATKTPLRGGLGEGEGFAPPYSSVELTAPDSRLVVSYGDDGETPYVDQMTQHPPLFYFAAAKVLELSGALDWAWDGQLLVLRLFSLALTLPLLPSLAYTVRRVGLSRGGSLVAAGTLFAVPQLAFTTGTLSNDSLAIGVGALTMAVCAHVMFVRASWRAVVLAGALLGIGLWSKGTFIPMGLVVFLSFVLGRDTSTTRQRLLKGVSAGGIGVLVGGAWWIRNLVVFHALQPAGKERDALGQGNDFVEYARRSLSLFVDSSWGSFGWLEWTLNSYLVGTLAGATAVALVVSVARGPDRLRRLTLLTFHLGVGVLLLVQAWTAYSEAGYVSGVQGRYLFPGIVGMLAVAGAAWIPGLEGLIRRQGWSFARFVPAVGIAVVALYALVAWARACYPGAGILGLDWSRWALAIGWDMSSLGIVVALGLLSLFGASIASVHALRASPQS